MYFYFRLIPNSGTVKKTLFIQLVNKQIHKLISGKNSIKKKKLKIHVLSGEKKIREYRNI